MIQRQDLAAVVSWTWFWGVHLEDHPRTHKWLIAMVSCCPLNGVIPLINGRTSWLINGGDPKYLEGPRKRLHFSCVKAVPFLGPLICLKVAPGTQTGKSSCLCGGHLGGLVCSAWKLSSR